MESRNILSISKQFLEIINDPFSRTKSNEITSLFVGLHQLKKLHPLETYLLNIAKDKEIKPNQKKEKLLALFQAMKELTDIIKKENADKIAIYHSLQQKTGHTFKLEDILPEIPTVNAQDSHGVSALIYAAGQGDLESMQLFHAQGANLNAQDGYQYTALTEAAWKGHQDCVQFLVQHDANLNLQTIQGNTALMLAIIYGHFKCVSLLVNAGCDTTLKNNEQQTAVTLAIDQSDKNKEAIFKPIIRCLVREAKIDVNAMDHTEQYKIYFNKKTNSQTLLIKAVRKNNVAAVEALLEEKADFTKTDSRYGATALRHAIANGYLDCIRLLMKAGAREERIIDDILTRPTHFTAPLPTIACLIECGQPITNLANLKKFLDGQPQQDRNVIYCQQVIRTLEGPVHSHPWRKFFVFSTPPAKKPEQPKDRDSILEIPKEKTLDQPNNIKSILDSPDEEEPLIHQDMKHR